MRVTVLLFILYLLLPLVPIALFLQAAENNIDLFIRISRIAGIYAFVWYALQFIVTARSHLLEWVVAQDKRLVLHMMAAVGIVMIVAVHTSFGNENQANEIQAGFGGTADTVFLLSTLFSGLFFSNYFIRFLPVIIPYRDKITAAFQLNHERCLLLHYTMPVVMVLLLVHILLLPGQGLMAFKACMSTIACSSLAFYLYYKLIVPKMMQRDPWKVAKVIQESDSVVTLSFEPPSGKKLKHHAGQFCYIRLLDSSLPDQSHPFTISSSPEDDYPSITVKQLGDFTAEVKQIPTKSLVSLDGPYGKFSYGYVPSEHSLVFIAGGIGVTPMLSMLRDLSIKDSKRKVILIWGARRETDLIRIKEIQKLSTQLGQFAFEPILSCAPQFKGRKGRIDETVLTEVLNSHGIDMGAWTDCEFFICGPAPMTAAVLKVFASNKIPSHRIHTERFAF